MTAKNKPKQVHPSTHRSNIATKADFLSRLRAGRTVSEAAKATGTHRRTFYDWRDQDAEFRQAWEDAIQESIEELESEVRTRALDKSDKSSHLLLMFLLKKHDPTYRENYKREVTVKHEKVQEFEFSQAEMDEAIDILTRQKEATKTKPSEEG